MDARGGKPLRAFMRRRGAQRRAGMAAMVSGASPTIRAAFPGYAHTDKWLDHDTQSRPTPASTTTMSNDTYARQIGTAVVMVVAMAACRGSDDTAVQGQADRAGTAAESFAISGTDGPWSSEITPARIVFRNAEEAPPDSLVFEYREPRAEGVTRTYSSVRLAPESHRIDIVLSTMPCRDATGATHEQTALVWVDRVQHLGCASRK